MPKSSNTESDNCDKISEGFSLKIININDFQVVTIPKFILPENIKIAK